MSAVPGKAPAVKLPPQVESARELLLEELARLLTIEETLAKLVLPELLREVEDDGLKQAVEEHLGETRGHVGRVKEAFLALGTQPFGRPAYGLDGLRSEHKASAPKVAPGLRTAVHVASAMGTEHYEINAYGAAIRLADAGARRTSGASCERTWSRRSARSRSSAAKQTGSRRTRPAGAPTSSEADEQ